MATLSCRVGPGETVALHYAARCEPWLRYGEQPPGVPVASATADAAGVASFTGQPSRIEFYAVRSNGRFVKLIDSTTRGGS